MMGLGGGCPLSGGQGRAGQGRKEGVILWIDMSGCGRDVFS